MTQAGIEPGHPRTLFPDDAIHKIIGYVGSPIYDVNEVLITSSVTLVTQYTYKMYTFFFFQVTQPGIEPGYPRTLHPEDVIRKIIGHVGHPIYDVNEVLFI